jgi:integrase
MAAITDPEEVGGLMRAIGDYCGDEKTRIALQLAALTFVRPGELRHWEWREVNWIKREWLIPSKKMKMKQDHIVPLSDQAFECLQEIHSLTGQGKYVFPSVRTGDRPMSNNTILAALRRMGFTKDEMSGHGFRAMASTLMNDLEWDSDLIELQLSHVQEKVRAAYNRAAKLKPRKKLMQDYADLLDRLRDGKAVEEMAQ